MAHNESSHGFRILLISISFLFLVVYVSPSSQYCKRFWEDIQEVTEKGSFNWERMMFIRDFKLKQVSRLINEIV